MSISRYIITEQFWHNNYFTITTKQAIKSNYQPAWLLLDICSGRRRKPSRNHTLGIRGETRALATVTLSVRRIAWYERKKAKKRLRRRKRGGRSLFQVDCPRPSGDRKNCPAGGPAHYDILLQPAAANQLQFSGCYQLSRSLWSSAQLHSCTLKSEDKVVWF